MRYLILIAWIFSSLFAQTETFEFGGIQRSYLLHVPSSYQGKAVPLVIFLHGAGGNSEGAARHNGWLEKADQEGFIAVFPQGAPLDPKREGHFFTNPNIWNDGLHRSTIPVDDIAYLRKVIGDVTQSYKIDPKKIYLTGFSNGASMTFRAGIEMSDLLAAIAPVSGHLWLKDPKPRKKLSMMLITGDADPLNPLNGGLAENPWTWSTVNKPPMIDSVLTWLKVLNLDPSKKRVVERNGVTYTTYGPNDQGKEVIFIVIKGQGHIWPCGVNWMPERYVGKPQDTLNATETIWNFFTQVK